MLKARNIHKSFGELPVLKGIDLHVKKGEIVSIVGASGAGKSTLLHILGTIDKANKGELEIDNTKVSNLNDKKLVIIQKQTHWVCLPIPSFIT